VAYSEHVFNNAIRLELFKQKDVFKGFVQRKFSVCWTGLDNISPNYLINKLISDQSWNFYNSESLYDIKFMYLRK